MPTYLIRLNFSEPKNPDQKGKSVEREMEIPNNEIALERATHLINRERMLDDSVVGAQVYKKDRFWDEFELIGEIKLLIK
jgi:hypothetical protein